MDGVAPRRVVEVDWGMLYCALRKKRPDGNPSAEGLKPVLQTQDPPFAQGAQSGPPMTS
jgi:hypothetical protein